MVRCAGVDYPNVGINLVVEKAFCADTGLSNNDRALNAAIAATAVANSDIYCETVYSGVVSERMVSGG